MIVHQGVFLPDGETHLTGWMDKAGEIVDGRGSYQIKKLRAAVGYCKQFRTAVDVGAHCGLWSMQLTKRFAHVHSFEPVAAHRECFALNVNDCNVTLHPAALGESKDSIHMRTTPTSSGDSWIDGAGDIPMERLDDYDLLDVDFIKLDCEGSELPALRGGERTIRRWNPVICVEQKPGRAQRFGLPERGAVDYLIGLDYQLAQCISGDYILVP